MEDKAGANPAVKNEQLEGEHKHDGIADSKHRLDVMHQLLILQRMYQYVPNERSSGKMIFDDHFSMRQELKAVRKHMEDTEFNEKVLCTLPSRFTAFRLFWKKMTKPEDQSTDYLRESLVDYDRDEQLQREHDLMLQEHRNQKRKCFACGKSGHMAAYCHTKKGK